MISWVAANTEGRLIPESDKGSTKLGGNSDFRLSCLCVHFFCEPVPLQWAASCVTHVHCARAPPGTQISLSSIQMRDSFYRPSPLPPSCATVIASCSIVIASSIAHSQWGIVWQLETVIGFDLQSAEKYEAVQRGSDWPEAWDGGWGGGWPRGLRFCGQCSRLPDLSVGTRMDWDNLCVWHFKKSWWSCGAVVLNTANVMPTYLFLKQQQ